MVGTDRKAISSTVGVAYDLIILQKTRKRIAAPTLLWLFLRSLDVGPVGNRERSRLLAHLGFALFDTQPRKTNRQHSTKLGVAINAPARWP